MENKRSISNLQEAKIKVNKGDAEKDLQAKNVENQNKDMVNQNTLITDSPNTKGKAFSVATEVDKENNTVNNNAMRSKPSTIETDRDLTESIRAWTEVNSERNNDDSRFSYTVIPEDGKTTAKQILRKRMGFSGRLLSKIKKGGTVTRNGVEIRLFADVIPGDVINVKLPEERCNFIAQDIPIKCVYEDDDLLVCNKQPGIVVHPTMGHPTGTIANGLMKRMEETGTVYKIRFVNRLDRDTSGLLIVAKNSHCQDVLIKQMKTNRIEKKYVAVVHGFFTEDEGQIDLPIGKKEDDDIRRCVKEDGFPSVTHYKVKERLEYNGEHFTLLELRLETGRTHQIRVHMSHIGHPIVGDSLYGREEPELIPRQALHAALLRFELPVSNEEIQIEAELPDDMEDLLKILRES